MNEEEFKKLDLLVAEKVMDYVWMRYAGHPDECGDGIIEAMLWSPEEWEKFDKGKDGDRGRYMLDDGKYPREWYPSRGRLPRFSKDIAAAFELASKIAPTGNARNGTCYEGQHDLVLIQDETSAYRTRWWARFGGSARDPMIVSENGEPKMGPGWSIAGTVAVAICLAGLKHVGVEWIKEKV